MKKVLFALTLCLALLCGCSRSYLVLHFALPPGDGSQFVFSDQQLCPEKNTIRISAAAGIAKAEIILIPASGNGLQIGPLPLTQEQPVTARVEKGAWYRIGLAMPNDAGGAIAAELHLEHVEMRIE